VNFGNDSEKDTVRMGRRGKGQPAERGRGQPAERGRGQPAGPFLLARPPYEACE